MKKSLWPLLLILALFTCQKTDPVKPTADPLQHLKMAQELLTHITASNTTYKHGTPDVGWQTSVATIYHAYADCSGFLNALFEHAYGVNDAYLNSWLGQKRPQAVSYYEAIKAANRFQPIRKVTDVQPGDIIAIKYLDPTNHGDNTGHCMLVTSRPTLLSPVTKLIAHTTQYALAVIDSSENPHGPTDTRNTSTTTYYQGLGQGTFRLYADSLGILSGYSWSTQPPLADFNPQYNPIVIGRQTAFGRQ
ncbi:hypothetical protein [Siphonobacter sp. SORGH_AS_0500]|uniref:hypothetical protein n=1 Tax=Siphonobacter sp. SORGH_AS_0500 TaxID=1864824 RepID=UPI002855AB8F|nr:hypothetical protein [Siphonobacter sp. SORGH_AS_0500]MDR6197108.1 hypothetical protein [Siphonobacter sp. SORGH_AS_0500]